MTVVVRLPEELYESAKRFAALQGRQPSDVLADAWGQYLEANREQLAADLEQAAQMLRAGETDALAEFASRSARARAEAAADAARD